MTQREDTIGSIVKVHLNKCNGCMNCMKVCTVNVFIEVKEKNMLKVHPVNEEKCFFCLLCEIACPKDAIEVEKPSTSGDTLKALLDPE